MKVKINRLTAHPYHAKIYDASNASNDIEDLKQSIQAVGLLEKIVTNAKYEIISGYRRFLALKQLNYQQVDVEISNISSNAEIEALIYFNTHRIKTKRELLNEAKYLKLIWGQKRGRKRTTTNTKVIKLNSPINTRAKVADKLNISTGNLSKLEYINDVMPEFIDEIDKGKLTINQAHQALKKKEENEKIRNISTTLPTTITNDYYRIYNSSSDSLYNLEEESINCIITSPPYWMKRTYTNDSNELGAEKTSDEYVQNLVTHLEDSYRVLKNDGSFFLNIGDTFKDKCLQLIPTRVALELQKKGWIIRNSIIWHKNAIPFSTRDNLTSSYEYIFHLVKSKNYYYNEVLTPLKNQSITVNTTARKSGTKCLSDNAKVIIGGLKKGKKLEDYWTIDVVKTAASTQAEVKKYGGTNHPAPFPKELPILPILQTTKPGDTVLDLFSGSGTTSAVALLLGRKTIAYELNPNHNQLQVNRFEDAIKTYNSNNSQANKAA